MACYRHLSLELLTLLGVQYSCEHVPLTREQTETFRRKMTTEGFWKAVSRDTGGPAATDCDGWIVEGVHNGNYHVVERAVPNRKPSTSKLVQSLGRALANELGQMDMPKDER